MMFDFKLCFANDAGEEVEMFKARRPGHLFIFLTILVAIFQSVNVFANTTDEDISFRWVFVAQSEKDGSEKLIPITKDTMLKRGDKLKIMIDLDSECFIYVLRNNGDNQLVRLFPEEEPQSGEALRADVRYLPKYDKWYTLNNETGTERFYLIASSQPLVELENLLSEYDSSSETDWVEITNEIKNYIKNMRKQHKSLSSTAKRPIMIGGSFRNAKPKTPPDEGISQFAESVYAKEFFARTLTIKYE